MENLASPARCTKGISNFMFKPHVSNCFIDGLRISNSQVKRLEKELKELKEEVFKNFNVC